MTKNEQEKYLKDHPGSALSINAHPNAVHRFMRTANLKKQLQPGSKIRTDMAAKFRELGDSDKIKQIKDAIGNEDFQVLVNGAEAVLDPNSLEGSSAGEKVSHLRKALKIALPVLAAAFSGYWAFTRYEMMTGEIPTTFSPTVNGIFLALSALSFARSAKHIYNEVNHNDTVNSAPDIAERVVHSSSSDNSINLVHKLMHTWAGDLEHANIDVALLLRGSKLSFDKPDSNKIEADFMDDAHIEAIEYSKTDEKNKIMTKFNNSIRQHRNLLISAVNNQNPADVEAMQYVKQFNEGRGVGIRGTVSIVKMFRRMHRETIRKLDNVPDYKVGSFVLVGGITIAFFNTIISIAFVVLIFLLAYGALKVGFALTRFLNLNKLKADTNADVWKEVREGRNPDDRDTQIIDGINHRVLSKSIKDDLNDNLILFMDRLSAYIERRGGTVLTSKNIKMVEKIL